MKTAVPILLDKIVLSILYNEIPNNRYAIAG
jgi:hypothetical protein